ncbi:sensor domain-containing diguanylate cyclase [Leptospirillum ferriphilum]|uniref:sensor domain-containing diguanylate cyclase n=1 Tax=Leptospirillum ferriphilum TaxID=178606 RepID=UPI0006B2031C|nr:sensor domain-containing diguanylate cyclase [Leptospirillum ferriphilum]
MDNPSPTPSDAPDRLSLFQRFTNAFFETDRLIMQFPSPQTFFEKIGQIMMEADLAHAVWIGVVHPESEWIDWKVMTGIPEHQKSVFRISVDPESTESILFLSEAVRTHKMAIGNNFLSALTQPQWHRILSESGLQSSIAVPFRQKKGVGIFALFGNRVGFFETELASLIEKFSANLTFALENREREEDRRKKDERVSRLQRFTRSFAEINELLMKRPDPDQLFDAVSRIIVDSGQARTSVIGLVDPQSGWVQWGWSTNSPKGWEKLLRVNLNPVLPEGQTMTAKALRNGKIALENDYLNSLPEGDWKSFIKTTDIRAVTVVPFFFQQEIHGLLGVAGDRIGFFDQELIDLLDKLGKNITFGLENHAQEANQKNDAEKIRSLQRLTKALADTNRMLIEIPPPQKLLETACQIVVEAGETSAAWIGLIDPGEEFLEWKAASGSSWQFFKDVRISLDKESPDGQVPTAEALRTGLPQIVEDYSETPGSHIWPDAMQKIGLKSLCAIPFNLHTGQKGVLVVGAEKTSFFDDSLVDLLSQLASNIAFGLENWEREQIRKMRETEIRNLSLTDELTGLPNRRHFHKYLKDVLDHVQDSRGKIALAIIDLDGFKTINDSLGHPAGDKVLTRVGQNLQRSLSEKAFLSRIGGDEFAVLISDFENRNRLVSQLHKISLACVQEILFEDFSIRISASIGVSVFPDDTGNMEQMLRLADFALYRVKAEGKSGWLFADGETGKLSLNDMVNP